ncbi:MAG: PHP domain-containing protein [Nanoarchaeota archaeon]|nr:PHP domain-containing protein [Nanoarchaeota archaeon]
MAKVDCHVHSKYSHYITLTHSLLTFVGAKESYNELEDIYNVAKKNGMDYVAITDHDTIKGALILNDKYPDVIIGEELEVKASDEGHLVHIVTLGVDEKMHKDLKDLKKIGLKETTGYLKQKDVFYFLSHLAHSASGKPLPAKLLHEWIGYVDALEILNGVITPQENNLAMTLACLYDKKIVGGSDAHTLENIGKTFTEAKNAKSKEEFLQALKKGEVYVQGEIDYSTKWLASESFKFIYNSLKDVLFCPEHRQRPPFRKLLDHITVFGVAVPSVLYLTIYLPALLYKRKHAKRAVKLLDEITDYYYEQFKIK